MVALSLQRSCAINIPQRGKRLHRLQSIVLSSALPDAAGGGQARPVHADRGIPPCLVVPGDIQIRLCNHARLGCDARVAGHAEQHVASRGLRQLPSQCMFPAASAHKQHVHLVGRRGLIDIWSAHARAGNGKHRSKYDGCARIGIG